MAAALGAQPLTVHPSNPHYFEFRGKPTILVTSGEHYGAVLNRAFDYSTYLQTLANDRLNLTRIFSGLYREVPGSFGITKNTLAPLEPDFVQPFRRVSAQRYDLSAWNEDYFSRLKGFAAEASRLGIIVEMTLFTSYYNDTHWSLSPLNAANNVQGVGKVKSDEVLTLKDSELFAVQERFVRKAVRELNSFDNVYFEVCNEPYFHGVAEDWQRRIAEIIVDEQSRLPKRHLISMNIANGSAAVTSPHPAISIFNFHYARPPRAVEVNYGLNKPIGMNETGFDGTLDAVYRIQAWDFLMAGGALYNNLDYSFAVGFENGTFPVPAGDPGGGSPRLRKQLGLLRTFFDAVPFTTMRPWAVPVFGLPQATSARLLSDGSNVYAGYLHTGQIMAGYQPRYIVRTAKLRTTLSFDLPSGEYELEWWHPREDAGKVARTSLSHGGGMVRLPTPDFTEDLAFTLKRR